MRLSHWRLLLVAVLAGVALTAFVGTTGAQAPSQQTQAGDAAANASAGSASSSETPDPCSHRYSAGEYRHKARWVYHRHRVRHRQLVHLASMRQCAVTPAAQASMRKITHRQARARHRRAARARMMCGSIACNKRLGYYLTVRRYGRGAWPCVDYVISRESGWNHRKGFGGTVGPPGRLAWGIPQALPPAKMSSAGGDWATNPRTQIRWYFGYVDARYGGPCGAMRYWEGHRSY